MANIPSEVGYFVLGLNDDISITIGDTVDDVDERPDEIPANGTLLCTPELPVGGNPLTFLPSMRLSNVSVVTCRVDQGKILAPANGISGAPAFGVAPGVRLLAPKQLAINPYNWLWRFDYTPDDGDASQPFTRWARPAPGQEVSLGELVSQPPAMTTAYQPRFFEVTTTDDPIPDGFGLGIDVLLLPNGNYYSAGVSA